MDLPLPAPSAILRRSQLPIFRLKNLHNHPFGCLQGCVYDTGHTFGFSSIRNFVFSFRITCTLFYFTWVITTMHSLCFTGVIRAVYGEQHCYIACFAMAAYA